MPRTALQLALAPETIRPTVSPPLKWAGGKRWLLPILRQLYRPHADRRLVEPFVGGMSVALGLLPRDALLSDINPHAINFYRCLKRGLKISIKMENERETYLRLRGKFNHGIRRKKSNSALSAALFYYLNRTGYNGLCRFNSSGLYNVPFGSYATINYVRDFSAYRDVLKKWKFACADFEKLPVTARDFVYADPPYDVPFTKYAARDFTWIDQVRLAKWLRKHRGPVVASNQESVRVRELYEKLGFAVYRLKAPRMISCSGDRTPANEILAVRNISPALLRSILGASTAE